MKEYFINIYEYNYWANKQILDMLNAQSSKIDDAISYFTHLIIAEKTWMERIKGDDSTTNFWQDIRKDDLEKIVDANNKEYMNFIYNLEETQFEEKINYKNSKGKEFNTSVKDILTHVALHSSYHRGQVNSAIRKAGGEPVNVDYIAYTRII